MTDQEINEAVARKLGFGEWIDQQVSKGGNLDWSPKDYSTDINAAWEIVETMVNGFCLWFVHGKYRVKVLDEMGTGEMLSEADTAPMAICLAFLKLEEWR